MMELFLNGRKIKIKAENNTQTLLQFLREERSLKGTKEGCNEGDCGACTVVEAVLDQDEKLTFKALNSCIAYLPAFAGRAIYTVDGIFANDLLHPAQQALIQYHGSQCGFCTPGFVMSLFALYENGQRYPNRETVLHALSGNLCRCTGYRPIIDAAMHMGDFDGFKIDKEALKTFLLSNQPVEEKEASQEIRFINLSEKNTFYAPVSEDELNDMIEENPNAVLLAGGTDIAIWSNKLLKKIPLLIQMHKIASLHKIEEYDGKISIYANVSINDAYAKLSEYYPDLQDVWNAFAGHPVRNAGTLIGNLANGSPIGDSAPALIALGAEITLVDALTGNERILLLEDLYQGYRKQSREKTEWLKKVSIPLKQKGHLRVYKVSKRKDSDISAVLAAFYLEVDNNKIQVARFAFGGMAEISKRAKKTEAALVNQPFDQSVFEQATKAIENDFLPITDMRASDQYRMAVAKNLVLKMYHDVVENNMKEAS